MISSTTSCPIGTEISRETISKITDEVLDEVIVWQQRPLESFYPVIYLDALVVKIRDRAHVRNKAAHIAVGVDMDGVKHVLGIWIQATEGAKFWAGVCAQLAAKAAREEFAASELGQKNPPRPLDHYRIRDNHDHTSRLGCVTNQCHLSVQQTRRNAAQSAQSHHQTVSRCRARCASPANTKSKPRWRH